MQELMQAIAESMTKQHYDDEVKKVMADLDNNKSKSPYYEKGLNVLKQCTGQVYGDDKVAQLCKYGD